MSTITPIGGLGSQDIQGDTSQQYDYSKAFGGSSDSSEGKVGNSFVFGESSAPVTINAMDPAAILSGQAVAQSGLLVAGNATQSAMSVATDALDKALALAGMSQQGSGGTIITGLIWLAGIGAAGLVLYAFFKSKKKD